MTTIKANSFEEAKLAVLLHQSQERERAMASNIVSLSVRVNRITAAKIGIENELELMRERAQVAEREVRRLKALRYSPRKKEVWMGVTP